MGVNDFSQVQCARFRNECYRRNKWVEYAPKPISYTTIALLLSSYPTTLVNNDDHNLTPTINQLMCITNFCFTNSQASLTVMEHKSLAGNVYLGNFSQF